MSQDRTAERQTFVTAIENMVKTGLSSTLIDTVICGDDLLHLQVNGAGRTTCQISAFDHVNDHATTTTVVLPSTLEEGVIRLWDDLESQRRARLARVINPNASCDGGYAPCKVRAVWAFKINPEDGWMYACGRHLTASLTEESAGEQAEFIVRRIVTEGC